MGILSWILFGLLAGIVAKFVMPGKDPGGLIITILLGIGGAFLGGFLMTQLGYGSLTGGWNWQNFGTAVAGAFLILFLFRLLRKR
jgi:uncharacterized membrane protein YeaQ/YmgE (transglycosylase-associated protein family)